MTSKRVGSTAARVREPERRQSAGEGSRDELRDAVGGQAVVGAGPVRHPHNNMLPFEPLERFVADRGGISRVMRRDSRDPHVRGGLNDQTWRSGGFQDLPAEFPDASRWLRSWYRAKNRGEVSWWWADRFCIHVLGVPPTLVYGSDW